MAEKVRWTYGELLRKRWNVSQILLETFVAEGLPVFDENDERFVYEDSIPGTIDTYKFRIEDVERFEIEKGHLFPAALNQKNYDATDGLGKRMTAEEVAVLYEDECQKSSKHV